MFFSDEDLEQGSEIRVLGLGSPIIDQIFKVDEDFIKGIEGEKGGSMALDIHTLNSICLKTKQDSPPLPGGSAANTIIGLSQLGTKCSLVGMIGKDEMGKQYTQRIQNLNVTPLFATSESQPTARVISLVTPDGQRTMRSFLGATSEMSSKNLSADYFKGIHLLHCEGYSLYNENGMLTRKALELAKAEGVRVSIDLASFELVRRYRPLLEDLLKDYVDIVFCNEDEAKEFHQNSIEDVCQYLASLCDIAVLMLGPKGCYVQQGTTRIFVKTNPVQCRDATGAGDLFASGFLHRILRGYSLKECCELGHTLGREIVQVFGAQLPDSKWKELNGSLNSEPLSPFKWSVSPSKLRSVEKDQLYSNVPLSSSF